MTLFRIKAVETVTYVYDVEADTVEDAIDMVESGVADDMMEVDSTSPEAIAYAVVGVLGWNEVEGEE